MKPDVYILANATFDFGNPLLRQILRFEFKEAFVQMSDRHGLAASKRFDQALFQSNRAFRLRDTNQPCPGQSSEIWGRLIAPTNSFTNERFKAKSFRVVAHYLSEDIDESRFPVCSEPIVEDQALLASKSCQTVAVIGLQKRLNCVVRLKAAEKGMKARALSVRIVVNRSDF